MKTQLMEDIYESSIGESDLDISESHREEDFDIIERATRILGNN